MKYEKPSLLNLASNVNSAVCLNGSGAVPGGSCTGGPGVSLATCTYGNGNPALCNDGSLASPNCDNGGLVNTYGCGDGSAANPGCETGSGGSKP